MMPREPANWIVAIPVLVITAIMLMWGCDLAITALRGPGRWRETLLDGSLWLGLFLLSLACFMSGAIGVLLLTDPEGTTPAWFGIGMGITVVTAIVAWWLLTFQDRNGGDDER